MPTTLLTLGFAALALVQPTDTTIPVRDGMRLDLKSYAGDIRVSTWQRDEVRITTGRTAGAGFTVERSGTVLRVRVASGRRGGDWDRIQDFDITAPPYLALDLGGTHANVVVDGMRSAIAVETVEGDIDVTGGDGFITLHSVEETVRLRDARGRIEVSSVDGDVFLQNVSGEITAESVDGDVELDDVRSASVLATTVDGDIAYAGTIENGGRYRFTTHDGEVSLMVPAETNATVTVGTFDGEFESSFPILLRESGRRRFTFTLGNGSAVVEMESFDGDISLRRR